MQLVFIRLNLKSSIFPKSMSDVEMVNCIKLLEVYYTKLLLLLLLLLVVVVVVVVVVVFYKLYL